MTRRPPPNSPRAHWEDILGMALSRAVPIVGANGSNAPRKPSVADQARALEDLENEGNRVRLHDNGAWVDLVDEEVPGPDDHVEDDFQAMLRARARAGIGARSELDMEIQFREQAHEDLQKIAPSQRTNPPSAYRGQLGNSAIILSNLPPTLICQWQGDPIEATMVCVTAANNGRFASAPPTYVAWPTQQGTIAQYRPFARILFGNHATSATFDCDIGRGVSFALGCSAISVSLGLDTEAIPATPMAMNLSAMLSFTAPGRVSPLIRTRFVDNLASSGTQAVIVPNFAQRLLPVQMGDGAGTGQVRLEFRDVNSGVIYRLDLSAPGQQVAPIPISDEVYDILVTNTGANTSTYRLPFELMV